MNLGQRTFLAAATAFLLAGTVQAMDLSCEVVNDVREGAPAGALDSPVVADFQPRKRPSPAEDRQVDLEARYLLRVVPRIATGRCTVSVVLGDKRLDLANGTDLNAGWRFLPLKGDTLRFEKNVLGKGSTESREVSLRSILHDALITAVPMRSGGLKVMHNSYAAKADDPLQHDNELLAFAEESRDRLHLSLVPLNAIRLPGPSDYSLDLKGEGERRGERLAHFQVGGKVFLAQIDAVERGAGTRDVDRNKKFYDQHGKVVGGTDMLPWKAPVVKRSAERVIIRELAGWHPERAPVVEETPVIDKELLNDPQKIRRAQEIERKLEKAIPSDLSFD